MGINKKIIISLIISFIIINLYLCSQSFAGILVDDIINTMSASGAGFQQRNMVTDLATTILAVFQVGITGFFVIRFSVVGIKYFTTVAATRKAECKGELTRTFIWGVVAFSATQFARIAYEFFNPGP